MQFNSSKCVVPTVSSPLTMLHKFCNGTLTHVTKAKYLGLTLDQHSSFKIITNASLSFLDEMLTSVVAVLNLMLTKLMCYGIRFFCLVTT